MGSTSAIGRSRGFYPHVMASGHASLLVIVIAAILVIVGGIWLLAAAWPRSDADDKGWNEDGPGGNGPGGRGPRRRDPDSPVPGGNAPEWWPEFEREFADYVQRERQATPVRSLMQTCL